MSKNKIDKNSNYITIDTTGLICPIPVLKLQRKMKELSIGEKIELICDDPASRIDVPHFCEESKSNLLDIKIIQKKGSKKHKFVFFIQK